MIWLLFCAIASAVNYTPLSKEIADLSYVNFSNSTYQETVLKASTAIQPNTTAALYAVSFNTTITNTLSEGQLGWNSEDGTLDVGMAGGNVTLQIGQEDYIRARNESGAALTNGWVVYQTGFSGNKPLIDVHNGGHAPLGIATENIPKNNNGYVTLRGLVRDVNTSAYSLNAELYASTNGPAITNSPAYPTDAFQVGRVAKVHATEGVILAQTPTCAKSWAELDEQYKTISDTNIAASASNVGRMRYYKTSSNSFIDVSMQTGTNSYSWVNVQSFGW